LPNQLGNLTAWVDFGLSLVFSKDRWESALLPDKAGVMEWSVLSYCACYH
jgi:hypothetical protein